MKRTLIAIIISLAAAFSAMAQNAAQQKPEAKEGDVKPALNVTVDQVLDKYIQAIGGKAAVEKVTSRTYKGFFDIPAMGVSAPLEAYSQAPNKRYETVSITGFGLIQLGFDGSKGWAQDPQTGMRDISGLELVSLKRRVDFYRELKLKEQYNKMTVVGKEKVGSGEAYVVEAVPTEGDPEKFYFDTQTGLLIRNDTMEEGPQGKVPVQSYLEDYKEVDGVKIPFTTRQVSPVVNITVRLTEIKQNVPIDETKFNKPAAK
jgi:hypothetical protein